MIEMIAEWSGCFFGVAGAAFLASNTKHSRFGWVCFFVANFCYITLGIVTGLWGLVVQQTFFTVTTVVGLIRWFPIFKGRPV